MEEDCHTPLASLFLSTRFVFDFVYWRGGLSGGDIDACFALVLLGIFVREEDWVGKCFADLEAFLVNGLSWVDNIHDSMKTGFFSVGLVWFGCSARLCRVVWIVWFLIAPGLLHNLRTEVC